MKRYIGFIFSVLLLASCSSPANNDSNTSSSKNNEEEKKDSVELIVDKDNIKDLNNATDDEISSSANWLAYNPGVGLDRSFYSNYYYTLSFSFTTGFKYVTVNSYNTSTIFPNYFVIRKGTDNNFYLIYYKEEDDVNVPQGQMWGYKYCYDCYQYLVSDNYLKLQQSDVIFNDVYDYVQSKL